MADARPLPDLKASLTAQQPINNVAHRDPGARRRVRRHAVAAHQLARRGVRDPSEAAIKIAVRTQQIILHESGAAGVVDPLGSSYYVESLTSRIEEEAAELIGRIDDMGGMIAAVESGYATS